MLRPHLLGVKRGVFYLGRRASSRRDNWGSRATGNARSHRRYSCGPLRPACLLCRKQTIERKRQAIDLIVVFQTIQRGSKSHGFRTRAVQDYWYKRLVTIATLENPR